MHLVLVFHFVFQLVSTTAVALVISNPRTISAIVPHQLEEDESLILKPSLKSFKLSTVTPHRLDSRVADKTEAFVQDFDFDPDADESNIENLAQDTKSTVLDYADRKSEGLKLRDAIPMDYEEWNTDFGSWEDEILDRRDSASMDYEEWNTEFGSWEDEILERRETISMDYSEWDTELGSWEDEVLERRNAASMDYEEWNTELGSWEDEALQRRETDDVSAYPAEANRSTYPVDDPDHPLKQRPDQLISPIEDLPQKYFNASNFRPWRPSHDKARPKERLDWRQPRKQAYCILGGVGKRRVFWQPKLAQDFFSKHHQHSHRERGPMFSHSSHSIRGHDFQYFWNTDPDTNRTKAYSMFITASRAQQTSKTRVQNAAFTPRYHSKKSKLRLEHCRQACETCFDAAQETGAEQFICSREEGHNGRHNDGEGGYCRAAMVLGDPVGRPRTCQITGSFNRLCGDNLEEVYAQDGAVHNSHPSLVCDSIRPCTTDACQVSHDTRLLAQGASCRMLTGKNGGPPKAAGVPRWPLLGYTSLADAMDDPSLFIYYQDFSTNATAEEKAFVLDSESRFGPELAIKEYAPWWTNYSIGDPTPYGWNGTNSFRLADDLFTGKVGFGSVPGGFILQNTMWSKYLIANLTTTDMSQRELYKGGRTKWLAHPDERDGPR